MLPGRATTEDDIETLHQWGATMARFQIMRRFLSVEDNQDLPEYWAWIDKRLDNLENVLKWAQARRQGPLLARSLEGLGPRLLPQGGGACAGIP